MLFENVSKNERISILASRSVNEPGMQRILV